MLDIFLKVAHEHESKQAHSLELAKALSHLPEEELKKLARTGEIKLASTEDWAAQFKGTELYTKAIELEAESLQKEASAEVRVKQRLLELVKTSGHARAFANGAKRVARGAVADVQDALGRKDELLGGTWRMDGAGGTAARAAALGTAGGAGYALGKHKSKKKEASIQWADEAGRIFARNDMAKLADTASIVKALKPHAGAIIGGSLGAIHGLAKKDGGIMDAALEGAGGAAVGAGAQRVAQHPDAAKAWEGVKDSFNKGRAEKAGEMAKLNSAYELRKEAFGAALAGLAKSALPAVTGFIKANPLKAGLAAAQTIGGGIANKQQGGSFLGGALSGGLNAAGTLAG